VSGGAGGASLSVQWRNLNASSEDPGAWTISSSDDWAAQLYAVRPAAVASDPLNANFMRNRRGKRRQGAFIA